MTLISQYLTVPAPDRDPRPYAQGPSLSSTEIPSLSEDLFRFVMFSDVNDKELNIYEQAVSG